MRLTTLRALALGAALLAPVPALAQSDSDDQNTAGPGMMWNGPGMMWGNGDGNGWGPGMMGRGGYGNGYGYGMMGGCQGGAAMGGPMMGGGNVQRSASAWLDGQLAYAHTELGITADQEPAWKAYAAAVHDRTDQMLATHQAMWGARREGLPFDQAYDFHIKLMEDRLEALKASRDSALKLYKALTPEQQKKASWVLPQSMCMM